MLNKDIFDNKMVEVLSGLIVIFNSGTRVLLNKFVTRVGSPFNTLVRLDYSSWHCKLECMSNTWS